MPFWLGPGGGLVVGATGLPIDCATCPCEPTVPVLFTCCTPSRDIPEIIYGTVTGFTGTPASLFFSLGQVIDFTDPCLIDSSNSAFNPFWPDTGVTYRFRHLLCEPFGTGSRVLSLYVICRTLAANVAFVMRDHGDTAGVCNTGLVGPNAVSGVSERPCSGDTFPFAMSLSYFNTPTTCGTNTGGSGTVEFSIDDPW